MARRVGVKNCVVITPTKLAAYRVYLTFSMTLNILEIYKNSGLKLQSIITLSIRYAAQYGIDWLLQSINLKTSVTASPIADWHHTYTYILTYTYRDVCTWTDLLAYSANILWWAASNATCAGPCAPVLCSETRTTSRPSDDVLARTNSSMVMFWATAGRWKWPKMTTLMR